MHSNNLVSVIGHDGIRALVEGPISEETWVGVLNDTLACLKPYLSELSLGSLGEFIVLTLDHPLVSTRLASYDLVWGKTAEANVRGLFVAVQPTAKWREQYPTSSLPPIIGINREGGLNLIAIRAVRSRKDRKQIKITRCRITPACFEDLVPDVIGSPESIINGLVILAKDHVNRRQRLLEKAQGLFSQLEQISLVTTLVTSSNG